MGADHEWEVALSALAATSRAAIIDRVRAAWPWYRPTPELLALAGLDGDDPLDRIWEDLALLDGVRSKQRDALEVFERAILARVRRALVQWGAGDLAEDLLQDRLVRLLGPVSQPGAAKATGGIGWVGRGRLLHWLRVTLRGEVVRKVTALKRRDPGVDSVVSALAGDLGVSAQAMDVELDVALLRHGPAVRQSMAAGFDALSPRQKSVLRYVLLDGLTAHQVRAIYGSHRVTVQTWLRDARETLLLTAKQTLRQTFGIREATDVLAQVARRVDLSLSRHLPKNL